MLTQDVAAQAGPSGIRINCLAPEDVARAAVFLAADTSAWITGVVLDIAGGAVLV